MLAGDWEGKMEILAEWPRRDGPALRRPSIILRQRSASHLSHPLGRQWRLDPNWRPVDCNDLGVHSQRGQIF